MSGYRYISTYLAARGGGTRLRGEPAALRVACFEVYFALGQFGALGSDDKSEMFLAHLHQAAVSPETILWLAEGSLCSCNATWRCGLHERSRLQAKGVEFLGWEISGNTLAREEQLVGT